MPNEVKYIITEKNRMRPRAQRTRDPEGRRRANPLIRAAGKALLELFNE